LALRRITVTRCTLGTGFYEVTIRATEDGRVLDRRTIQVVGRGWFDRPRHHVLNVLGAQKYEWYEVEYAYVGIQFDPPRRVITSVWFDIDVDYMLTSPPERIQTCWPTASKTKRTALRRLPQSQKQAPPD
jgi:hypothetical protein